jgi:uncharacterized protein (TIGR00645 family)
MENTKLRKTEIALERIFFSSRWIAAPVYFGLTASLIVLAIKFFKTTYQLVFIESMKEIDDIVTVILTLLDMTMVMSMVLIVMFAGYENFVSKLDVNDHPDYPRWMTRVTFGDIKLKILASIVVMSAIHLLSDYYKIDELSDRKLIWSIVFHVVFLFSALLMALMDKLLGAEEHSNETKE